MYFKLVLTLVIGCVVCAKNPWTAEKGASWWMERHERLLNQTLHHGKEIKAVFLGDSITDMWSSNGLQVWEKHYANRGAFNYGIGGDRTEQVLWRIEHGEFDQLNSKIVVLMIGTNNLIGASNPIDIVKGIKAIVDHLHQKMPNTNVLMLSILPRIFWDDYDTAIVQINKHISTLADNKLLHYYDLGSHFGGANSTNLKKQFYAEDHLHLNSQGYQVWYEAIEPKFAKLLA